MRGSDSVLKWVCVFKDWRRLWESWLAHKCVLVFSHQAKPSQALSASFLQSHWKHKDDVVLGLEDAQSPAVVTFFRYPRVPTSTWKLYPAPANDTPTETSWPLTEGEFILSLCWFTKETSGLALECLLNRSILFNPRDDAFPTQSSSLSFSPGPLLFISS